MSVDAFHRGRFHVVQPLGRGHRSGLDALLLASSLSAEAKGDLADLGAGAGAAGLAALSRCPDLRATLVERDAEMRDFCRRTLQRPENGALGERARIVAFDVAGRAAARAEAGLVDASFDAVIANPPYNAAADRRSDDRLRAAARSMEDGTPFEDWTRTAAALLRTNGLFALICRPTDLVPVLSTQQNRFGGQRIVFVHPRERLAAIRMIVVARRASRAPLAIEPPLILHGESGSAPTERAAALIDGAASLFPA